MARNSLAAAKAELVALLTAGGVPTVAGVTVTYDHEPFAGHAGKPVSLTVATAGMNSDWYLLAVRIYQTADVDAKAAQDSMDALIMAVEAKFTARMGPSNWEVEFRTELAALVATCILQVGREDDLAYR